MQKERYGSCYGCVTDTAKASSKSHESPRKLHQIRENKSRGRRNQHVSQCWSQKACTQNKRPEMLDKNATSYTKERKWQGKLQRKNYEIELWHKNMRQEETMCMKNHCMEEGCLSFDFLCVSHMRTVSPKRVMKQEWLFVYLFLPSSLFTKEAARMQKWIWMNSESSASSSDFQATYSLLCPKKNCYRFDARRFLSSWLDIKVHILGEDVVVPVLLSLISCENYVIERACHDDAKEGETHTKHKHTP